MDSKVYPLKHQRFSKLIWVSIYTTYHTEKRAHPSQMGTALVVWGALSWLINVHWIHASR